MIAGSQICLRVTFIGPNRCRIATLSAGHCNWTKMMIAGSHKKLQSALHAAAILVLQPPHRDSVSDIMRRQLHWLEMPNRVKFNLCSLRLYNVYADTDRCLHGLAHRYLSDLCTYVRHGARPSESICDTWTDRTVAINPLTETKTISPLRFYVASSAAWNALPVQSLVLVLRLSYNRRKGAVQLFISYQINVFSVFSWKQEKSKFHL